MRALVLAGALLAVLAAAVPALAADGRRWPGRTITYSERPADKGVRDAARLWNRSGVRIRFVRVRSQRRADVRIEILRGGCGGFAQLGYNPFLQARMVVGRCARWTQTQVAAHEFGHILGLSHTSRGCALMNPLLDGGAPSRCGRPADGRYRCRVLEPRDLRRAVRKYGGRARPQREDECPLYPEPPALASLLAATSDGYSIDVEAAYPAEPRPVVRQEFTPPPGTRLELAHVRGVCPADLTGVFASPAIDQDAQWSSTVAFTLSRLGEGAQCVAGRLADPVGRTGPATGVTVEMPAEPAASGA